MASHPQGIHPNLAPRDRRSPWWAIATGVSITVAINAVIPYTHHYMHTISLVEGMIPMGILMPFLVLIFVVNPVLRALGCALQPWELIFIFAVGYASMSINELLGRVLATYAVMHYMATPENLWEEYVFGLVQPYLVVEGAEDQLAWFYEGLPRNAAIPWAIWLRPTFWWLRFYRRARHWLCRSGNDFAPAMGGARAVAVSLCTGGRGIGRDRRAEWVSQLHEATLVLGRFCHSGRDCAVVYHRLFRSRLSRDYRGDSELQHFVGTLCALPARTAQLFDHRICVFYRFAGLVFDLGVLGAHMASNRHDQSHGPGRGPWGNSPGRGNRHWAVLSSFACGDCGLRASTSRRFFNTHFASPKTWTIRTS